MGSEMCIRDRLGELPIVLLDMVVDIAFDSVDVAKLLDEPAAGVAEAIEEDAENGLLTAEEVAPAELEDRLPLDNDELIDELAIDVVAAELEMGEELAMDEVTPELDAWEELAMGVGAEELDKGADEELAMDVVDSELDPGEELAMDVVYSELDPDEELAMGVVDPELDPGEELAMDVVAPELDVSEELPLDVWPGIEVDVIGAAALELVDELIALATLTARTTLLLDENSCCGVFFRKQMLPSKVNAPQPDVISQ